MDTSSTNLAVSYDGYYTTDGVTAYIYGTDSYYVDLTRERYGTAVNIDATNSFGEHYLYGDEAANVIISGSNASTLWGGLDYANDILVGGWDYDTFYYGKNEGSDTILNASLIDTVSLYDASTSDIVYSTYDGDMAGGTLALYFNTGNALFVAYSGSVSPTFTTYNGGSFAFDSSSWTWESSAVPQQSTGITYQQIDWNSAPRFDNDVALFEYLSNCRYNLQTTVPVVCVNGFVPNSMKIPDVRILQQLGWMTSYSDGKYLYTITNYPGERVAYAYTHGNTSFLTAEELQLYNVGVQIVSETKNFSTDPLLQELYIHDAITDKVTYYSDEYNGKITTRYQSALGALIDGQANCQGYTDAFYMLGTMCGFNIGKVGGVAGGGHAWNTITFGDKSYFVDVTWDDATTNLDGSPYNNYIYFNAPTDVAGTNHQWYPYHVPQNLQTYPDAFNFYHAPEYGASNGRYFGTWSPTASDAIDHLAYRIANLGYQNSWVGAPYDYYYSDPNNAANQLANRLASNYGWAGTVNMSVSYRGNYMYFIVRATQS